MNKKIRYISLLFCIMSLFIGTISAVVYSDNNNPGAGTGSSSGASGGTTWDSYVKAVRLRVFRSDGTKVNLTGSEYLFLSNTIDGCWNQISAKVCETPGFSYNSLIMNTASETNPSSCSDVKQVNLGCLVADRLRETFKLSGGTWSYDGSFLDDFLSEGTYKNLKDILNKMGYKTSSVQDGDYVIIEPATRVTCNNTFYFGTSTALMLKNVSYSGVRGYASNVCRNNDSKDGYTFMNLFDNMSKALKISSSESWSGYSGYDEFGYFKYNVSDMNYVVPPPTTEKYSLALNVILDGELITTPPRNPSYLRYDFTVGGNESSSTYYYKNILDGTNYEISNIVALNDYVYLGYNTNWTYHGATPESTSTTITGIVDSDKQINLILESPCENRVKNIKNLTGIERVRKLFELYNDYLDKPESQKKDYRGLLNIKNPKCEELGPPSKEIKNLTCLSASTKSHANFHELNLSGYDEKFTNSSGDYIGFCLTSMYLKNNLGVQKFYSKSGQFLIKQENDDSEIEILNSSYRPVRVCGNDVATTTIRKMCYFLPGETLPAEYTPSSSHHVTLFFGDNDGDGIDTLREETSEIKDGKSGVETTNGLIMYEFLKETKYKLNTLYLEKISGKIVENGNHSLNGVVSKFNATSGVIPFVVKYDYGYYQMYYGMTDGEYDNLCTYKSDPEIIIGDLNLEFRTIDTKAPFNRKTMSNWSDGTNRSKDNAVVNKYIKNAVNSYGLDKDGKRVKPKYSIKLTSEDIKNIRKYNNQVPYDNYKVECTIGSDGEEICENVFLKNLVNKKVVLYNDKGEVVKTLTNSWGLTKPPSKGYVSGPTTSTSTTSADDLKNKKICSPVSSSANGNVPRGNYDMGDEYICEVKPGTKYHFFVIGKCGNDKINMIMSQNLPGSVTSWAETAESWTDIGQTLHNKGPLKALSVLEDKTKDWSNIIAYNYTLIDEIDNFKNHYKYDSSAVSEGHATFNDPDFERYAPIELNGVRARLLTRNEASECGCARTLETCPSFLSVGVAVANRANVYTLGQGYWLSNSSGSSTDANDIIDDDGDMTYSDRKEADGIRPVITVYRSQINS